MPRTRHNRSRCFNGDRCRSFSTEDSVLDNFKSYPRIRAYVASNYLPTEGTDGFIMVDARRKPTRSLGGGRFPCFR